MVLGVRDNHIICDQHTPHTAGLQTDNSTDNTETDTRDQIHSEFSVKYTTKLKNIGVEVKCSWRICFIKDFKKLFTYNLTGAALIPI